MKFLRWSLTLIFFGLIAAVIAAQFVTLNQFKALAAQKVKQATGRSLDIAGDIKISFYPVLGAKVTKLSLSNVIGGEHPSMLSAEKMMVGVRVLPLFKGQVQLDKIILDKPMMYLEKDAAGKGNWEFTKEGEAEEVAPEAGVEAPKRIQLSGIEVTNGTLSYYDSKSRNAVELTKVDAKINMIDFDNMLTVSAYAQYQDMPIKVLFETDSPSSFFSEKGSATSLTLTVKGISGKMEGKVALTPNHITITSLEVGTQQVVARGKLDIELGGHIPVVNTTLDFGTVNLDPLLAMASGQAGVSTATGKELGEKNTYVDSSVFKSFEGSVALSADALQTSGWKISQPKIRANIASGIVATAAAGQFSSDSQSPMNLSATTPDLAALLSAEGGTFTAKAKSQNEDATAQGNLALVPGKLTLTAANIKMNNQLITGRATLEDHAGDQVLDADLQVTKNDREWEVSIKTPSLFKLMESDGSSIDLALQSGAQQAVINATISKVDNVLKVNPLNLKLNGGTGKGYLTWDQKTEVPMLNLVMDFAALDLNPLLSFMSDENNGSASGENSAPVKKGTPLKTTNAEIKLKAGQLKFKKLQMSNVDLRADLKDGILKLSLPKVGLYQGTANLEARVDGNLPDSQFTLNTEGTGVNIGMMTQEGLQSNTFSGIGNWKAEVSGTGFDIPAVYPTLGGRGELSLEQGTVRGMDLFKLMSAARGGIDALARASDETNNITAKGTFTISKGVLENNDLVVQSPNIEASGKGHVNLPQWQIDYRFDPKIGERRKGAAGEKFVGQNIPVLVQGSIDHPKIFPDPKFVVNKGLEILGKNVKGVGKFLAPLGLGGNSDEAPAANDNPAELPEPQKKKRGGFNVLRGLLGN